MTPRNSLPPCDSDFLRRASAWQASWRTLLLLAWLVSMPRDAHAQTVITTTTTYDGTILTIPGSGTSTNILTINAPGSPLLSLLNGGTVVGADATVVGATNAGQLLISGGSVLTNTAGSALRLLTNVGGQPIFQGRGYVGLADGTGTVTVDGTGSEWALKSNLLVGVSGTGTLDVQDGGSVRSSFGNLGLEATGNGTATISGLNSNWTVTNSFYVGGNAFSSGGIGAITVTDGGSLNVGGTLKLWDAGTLTIGTGGHVTARDFDKSVGALNFQGGMLTLSGGTYTHAAGSGTAANILTIDGTGSPLLEMTHGASVVGAESTVVGAAGSGQLLISDGSVLTNASSESFLGTAAGYGIFSGYSYIGLAAGSTGTATISGAGSQWTLTYSLEIGKDGTGVLNVQDGGTVQSFEAYLGDSTTGHGTATISGVGSQWTLTDALGVGWDGTGVLHVQDGGSVRSNYGNLGYNSSSNGTATISGASSQWTMTDSLNIGHDGTGVLNVQNGGSVASNFGMLGYHSDGNGTATITGPNSNWTVTDSLFVGGNETTSGGLGTVTVSGGGALNVGGLVKIWETGSLAIGSGGTLTAGSLDGDLTNNGMMVIGGTNAVSTYNGVISGSGSVTKVGSGSWTIGGVNTYSGATVVNAGILHIAAGGAINAAGGLTVADGASFIVDSGATLVGVGTINGAGSVVNNGSISGNIAIAPDNLVKINGNLAGNATIADGGTLGGSGVVVGTLSGGGLVAPGNSPGVLDAAQVDPTSGMDFLFQFTAANTSPDYLNRTNSLNDVLHLTDGTTPFLASMGPSNTITVDFEVASLHAGDTFIGGFFTNRPGDDFYGDGTLSNAIYNYLLNGSALDLSQWHVSVSTISQSGIDFGAGYGGVVDGRVMQFTLTPTAVPEPGSLVLAGTAAVGFVLRRLRTSRRRDSSEPPAGSAA